MAMETLKKIVANYACFRSVTMLTLLKNNNKNYI